MEKMYGGKMSFKFGDITISFLIHNNSYSISESENITCKISVQDLSPIKEWDFDEVVIQPKSHDSFYLETPIEIELVAPFQYKNLSVKLNKIEHQDLQNLTQIFWRIINNQQKIDSDIDDKLYYRQQASEDMEWSDNAPRNHYNDDLHMDQQSQEHWDNIWNKKGQPT